MRTRWKHEGCVPRQIVEEGCQKLIYLWALWLSKVITACCTHDTSVEIVFPKEGYPTYDDALEARRVRCPLGMPRVG